MVHDDIWDTNVSFVDIVGRYHASNMNHLLNHWLIIRWLREFKEKK